MIWMLHFSCCISLRYCSVAPELASREDLHPAGRVLSLALGLTDRQLCLTKTQTTGYSNYKMIIHSSTNNWDVEYRRTSETRVSVSRWSYISLPATNVEYRRTSKLCDTIKDDHTILYQQLRMWNTEELMKLVLLQDQHQRISEPSVFLICGINIYFSPNN